MLKRTFDILISGIMIIVLLPVCILIALWIKIDSRGPVLFKQERGGKDGKPFTIYKFRTMVVDAEKSGYFTAENDPRVTRSGSFLRKTSLDELPQLFNIFGGTMSIVGPRPTLMYQIEQYTPEQRKRLMVPPGVTGWAQVNGRNSLSWPERIVLDVWYAEHQSFMLDMKIIRKTFGVGVKGEGVYADKEKFVVGDNDMDKLNDSDS
jgi:undecaprenyl phosphate N,N'-diacetylbacillosamine 1-phosphate transferase